MNAPAALLHEANVAALAQACNALWLATLSLMTAFMHNTAPAHRYLLARKIASNFALLEQQPECFSADSRTSFARLARTWTAQADRLARQEDRPRGGLGLLVPALFGGR
ncbi:hypothetical protein [Ramlibacter sp. WS9]|uniref:hypothetical protein n=1 Tax=Ramlibacter sp. WS9 TaxID=1882741 RepID=UPI00114419FC|nr:hypothetical protein [Ramlibacter sp. WS9]ROZ72077.1 hypothetical protein EEB15_20065 [Ramlibacter sp. WS9]